MPNVHGIPETITHDQVNAALRALGLEPSCIAAFSMNAKAGGEYVTIEGYAPGDARTHYTITLPISFGPTAAELRDELTKEHTHG